MAAPGCKANSLPDPLSVDQDVATSTINLSPNVGRKLNFSFPFCSLRQLLIVVLLMKNLVYPSRLSRQMKIAPLRKNFRLILKILLTLTSMIMKIY